ncbi:uncharacterized protein LOC113856631 [Abrus precatorius]|uniref:Uncharacterized protein LOC113856631 n=1 Tax=Abrus precatorius TaxID=3816 RepID=A0A8B8KNM6_ABRPR|nr:uncharacterized protein LOC113856631 [Abrus precatorius]
MPLTFHGFSIRDYTSKMRSVDVFKCWPFAAAEVSQEDIESWLPPMTVPKSRCCSDQVAGLRSNLDGAGGEEGTESRHEEVVSRSKSVDEDNSFAGVGASEKEEEEKMEMVCPVCRDFNAATLTAVNAHIDGCLAETMREERRQMRRSKSKAPKKRSIAEIFDLKEDEEEEEPPPEIETVLKVWPFDADEVSITVTKFQWLSRRLEALRSNGISRESAKSDEGNSNSAEEEEKLEMVCPVCRVFNAATVTAVNAHIDGCLAKAMKDERWQMRRLGLNPKPKAPKKRSIAEILTVAPQIDATGNGDFVAEAEEEDEHEANREQFVKTGFYGATINCTRKSSNKNVSKKKKTKFTKKKSKVEKPRILPLNNESKKMNKKKKAQKKKLLNNEFTAKKVCFSACLHVMCGFMP